MNDYKLYKGAWVYQGKPQEDVRLTSQQIQELLTRGGVMVRNCYDYDCSDVTGFWYVIKDSFGGMDELSSRVRNKVRKSMKCLEIRMIDKATMLSYAYVVHARACMNYRVKADVVSEESFRTRILDNCDKYEYWGCFDKENGRLVAFSINALNDGWVNYETFKADPDYLKGGYYPFYGLLYEMNRYYLEEKKMKYVYDGARSITEHSNVQPFLIEQLKFRKAYCRLQIGYVWWMRIMVNMLYTFRKMIHIRSVQAVLNQEAMRRGDM